MVLIRESRQSDNHALAQLMGELGYPTSAESMRKRMEAIESSPMNGTFVAEMDNLIVGMIGLRVNNNYEYDDSVVQVVSLVTRAAYRGMGIGSVLILHAEEWAQARKGSAMTLTSGIKPERAAAHEFYKSKGYAINGYRFSKKLYD
ncbi:GNAT family N-acetyltransferase [Paenibacillus periandrae]|uniref:GNAT family N-acetyltransferase n=1 Tax=Paenibacillus periandrae TaxID=1761741 RepID=UPI001F08FBBF|nr:GNAT family N-acetyltransferase [Paenibacillus periandrae]